MISLKKSKPTNWCGNGFGSETAEWVVLGRENIAIRKLGLNWFAIDLSEYALINGHKVNKKIAKAETKKELLIELSGKI